MVGKLKNFSIGHGKTGVRNILLDKGFGHAMARWKNTEGVKGEWGAE